MSIAQNYIGIKGNITFRRAVTGLIEPTPDMCQPLLFVITRVFPNKHKNWWNMGLVNRPLWWSIHWSIHWLVHPSTHPSLITRRMQLITIGLVTLLAGILAQIERWVYLKAHMSVWFVIKMYFVRFKVYLLNPLRQSVPFLRQNCVKIAVLAAWFVYW